MTHRKWIVGLLLAATFGTCLLSGCKKKEPPPPVVKHRAPPPPPPPEPVEVATLMQEAKPDARVQFPEAQAPTDEGLARSVIKFADALARGDSASLKTMLDAQGKMIVDQLVGSGDWYDATKSIEAVRVASLSGGGGFGALTLAIQDPDGAYVLSWQAMESGGDAWLFMPLPSTNEVKRRVSDWDGRSGVAMPDLDIPADPGDTPDMTMPTDMPAAPPEAPERDRRRHNTPAGPVDIPGG